MPHGLEVCNTRNIPSVCTMKFTQPQLSDLDMAVECTLLPSTPLTDTSLSDTSLSDKTILHVDHVYNVLSYTCPWFKHCMSSLENCTCWTERRLRGMVVQLQRLVQVRETGSERVRGVEVVVQREHRCLSQEEWCVAVDTGSVAVEKSFGGVVSVWPPPSHSRPVAEREPLTQVSLHHLLHRDHCVYYVHH